jgi:hypothetical protein
MATKRLTGDLAQTTVGINPGIAIPGGATQVLGLTDWAITIKTKSIDGSTTDDDAWEDWLPSMSSWTAKAKFCYLMGDPSQMTNILQAILGDGRRTSSEWNFFLDSESGDDSFSGQAFISGLGISSIIGRTISMDVTLQGRGPLNLRNQAGFLAALVHAGGKVTKFRSVTLGGYTMEVTWSEFVPTSVLPDDAVIQGIYPVFIGSGIFDICFQNITYGDPLAPGGSPPRGGGFANPFDTNVISPGASFASTEFWGAQVGADSIGTSLSLLSAQQIRMAINSSLLRIPPPFLNDEMTATDVGYAILYTSSAPVTDPFMPPPFAVPPGQGLAWAVPLAVSAVADDGQGNTGTAVGNSSLVVE